MRYVPILLLFALVLTGAECIGQFVDSTASARKWRWGVQLSYTWMQYPLQSPLCDTLLPPEIALLYHRPKEMESGQASGGLRPLIMLGATFINDRYSQLGLALGWQDWSAEDAESNPFFPATVSVSALSLCADYHWSTQRWSSSTDAEFGARFGGFLFFRYVDADYSSKPPFYGGSQVWYLESQVDGLSLSIGPSLIAGIESGRVGFGLTMSVPVMTFVSGRWKRVDTLYRLAPNDPGEARERGGSFTGLLPQGTLPRLGTVFDHLAFRFSYTFRKRRVGTDTSLFLNAR